MLPANASTAGYKEMMRRPLLVLGGLWLILALFITASQLLYPPPIEVEWRTETEVNAAGFNIYRADAVEGPYLKLNDTLIPAEGNATSGGTYVFTDENIRPGATYYYRLEDVELDNRAAQHAPIEYTASFFQWWLPLVIAGCVLIGLFLLVRGLRSSEAQKERMP